MRISSFDNRRNYGRNSNHNEKVKYTILDNLSMTFGSIVSDFKIWLINDIKHFCKIHHTYIASQFNGTQDFWFTEGMLLDVGKPNLSLQYTIDHSYENSIYNHPSLKNIESVNIARSGQFMQSIIKSQDKNGNNIDIKLAFTVKKIYIQSGIVVESRSKADNIAHAWSVRRSDNSVYASKYLVDFQIPDYIIELLYERFNIRRDSHRPMLKWLHRNCTNLVCYAVNTYNGKPGFFIKYKARPIIRPSALSNPVGVREQDHSGDMWTITRSFELDIAVPTFLGVAGYVHPELPTSNSDNQETFNEDIVNVLRHERLSEYHLQIEDKHAILEYEMFIEDSDIIKLNDNTKITKKIQVDEILEGEDLALHFIEWGRQKGLDKSDLFEFVVNENTDVPSHTFIGKGHTLSEAMNKLDIKTKEEYKKFIDDNNILLETQDGRLLTIDSLAIPNEDKEYKNYIKNTREMWFIDIDPHPNSSYRITLYASMRLYNQFILETGFTLDGVVHKDDMAEEYATGTSKKLNDIQDRY